MVALPPKAKTSFASSTNDILTTTLPNPRSTTQTLQLWVEHSLSLSARTSVLVAQLNANHASAKTEHLAASVTNFSSQASKPLALLTPSSRLNVSRDLDKRQTLRKLRRHKLQAILRSEEQKRLEQQKAAEDAARQAAEQAVARAAKEQKAAQQVAQQAAQQAAQQEAQQAAQKEAQQAAQQATDDNFERKRNQPVSQKQAEGSIPNSVAATAINADKKTNRKVSFGPVTSLEDGKLLHMTPDTATDADILLHSCSTASRENLLPSAKQAMSVWKAVSEQADKFRQDFSAKKIRLRLKKRINLGVNQIAASIKQVSTKVLDLSAIIQETKSVAGAQGEAFAMREIAQRLIKEADGSVSLNQSAAFAVAAVIVGVSAAVQDPPRMRDVFLGAFYEYCMFTVPVYVRRRKDESITDYRIRIGYKDEETAESYLERMCGCIGLFAAVLQTERVYPGSNFGAPLENPFSLDLGWAWLARIVNMEQKSLTPAVVYAFLETAGYGMARRYRKQFAKLVAMVQRAVVMNAVPSAPKGPVTRLDIFISEFVSAGCTITKPPSGRELPVSDAENL